MQRYVAAARLVDDDVIVIIDFDPDHVLDDYLRRWEKLSVLYIMQGGWVPNEKAQPPTGASAEDIFRPTIPERAYHGS
ncbi:MAG: hypothetical protein D6795_18395 [Deltaproteobacteria bacterium]|nr:MAG: hypothetical protein D6795_18395 [Deltaproteobacteria bacterium]